MFEDIFRADYKVVKKELVFQEETFFNIRKFDLSDIILELEADIKDDYVKFKELKIKAWEIPVGYTMILEFKGMKSFNPCFLRLMKKHGLDFVFFKNNEICFMLNNKIKVD